MPRPSIERLISPVSVISGSIERVGVDSLLVAISVPGTFGSADGLVSSNNEGILPIIFDLLGPAYTGVANADKINTITKQMHAPVT